MTKKKPPVNVLKLIADAVSRKEKKDAGKTAKRATLAKRIVPRKAKDGGSDHR